MISKSVESNIQRAKRNKIAVENLRNELITIRGIRSPGKNISEIFLDVNDLTHDILIVTNTYQMIDGRWDYLSNHTPSMLKDRYGHYNFKQVIPVKDNLLFKTLKKEINGRK